MALKRLAILLKGYPRLSETFIAQEIHKLEQSGLEIDLVSLRHPTDKLTHPVHQKIKAEVNYLPEYLRDEPIRVIRSFFISLFSMNFWRLLPVFIKDLWRDRTINRIRRFGQALVLACELKSDTSWIYAHFAHTPGSVARYTAQLKGLPFSISAHAKDIWTIEAWELREKLLAAQWTVCCTKAYTDHLRITAPDADVRHLYHGIDLKDLPEPPLREARSAPVKILCVARAVEKKGIDNLLRALALLPQSLDWQLIHAGGGNLEPYRKLAKDLGLESNVTFLGSVDRPGVFSLMREADLFCLFARLAEDGDRDGLPNVLLEALSQKLCVIATDVAAIGELIINGKTGILVQGGKIEDFASAIKKASFNPEQRIALGSAGYHHVCEHFDADLQIGPLIKAFKKELA